MYPASYPEDSTLRRHFESAQRFRADEPPSDSVLRRHYNQRRQAFIDSITSKPAAQKPAARRTTAPPPQKQPTQQPVCESHGDNGGFFAWLKRLFG